MSVPGCFGPCSVLVSPPGPARLQTDVSTVEAAYKDLGGAAAQTPERNITTTTTVGDLLSGTQLVLRRGGTLLVMLAILAFGILLSHFLTQLLK